MLASVAVTCDAPMGETRRMPDRNRAAVWTGRLGVVLVVAGLALGAYVAWQVWGTDVVAQRTHRDLVREAEQAWAAPEASGDESVATDHGRVTSVVRIPRFGAGYAVPVLEGTSDEVLASGFGHFSGSAAAGAQGNFALAAHRITHGEPLRDMPALQPGDEVVVETARWTYTYVLDTGGDDLTVPFTAGWVLADVPRNPDGGVQPAQDPGQRLLTLTTCSELFHTDGRLVAFGHLASKEPTAR